MIEVYKSMSGVGRVHKEKFSISSHNRSTRGHQRKGMGSRLETSKRKLLLLLLPKQRVNLWNSLLQEAVKATTRTELKGKLDKFMEVASMECY